MAQYLNMDSVLGIEGGGTKTVALLATGARIQRRQFDALNLKLSTDRQILTLLRQFQPTRAAICLAGCRTTADRNRVHRLAKRAWPKAKVFTGNDLDSGLVAVFGLKQAGILVISGTGSVIVGRSAGGKIGRAGGWGHWLGDHGSGYWLALTGLRAAIRELDRTGQPSTTLRRLLRRLKLKSPEQLVEWIAGATKAEVTWQPRLGTTSCIFSSDGLRGSGAEIKTHTAGGGTCRWSFTKSPGVPKCRDPPHSPDNPRRTRETLARRVGARCVAFG